MTYCNVYSYELHIWKVGRWGTFVLAESYWGEIYSGPPPPYSVLYASTVYFITPYCTVHCSRYLTLGSRKFPDLGFRLSLPSQKLSKGLKTSGSHGSDNHVLLNTNTACALTTYAFIIDKKTKFLNTRR